MWRYKSSVLFLAKRILRRNYEFVNYTTQIQITDPAVQLYLDQIRQKYSKRPTPSHISNIIKSYSERATILDSIKNLDDLQSQDKNDEMKELVKEEKENYLNSLKIIDSTIVENLFPKEISYSHSECVLEVIAGVGGQEAMLFANEMLNMYLKYSNFRKWSVSVISQDESESGGLRHASLIISGPGAYEILSLEAGVHRVQRIPATEKSGRLHTSTVSVAVLLQPTDIEINIADKDIRVVTKTSTGAGGQHVNKTESCVRITHLPTGIVVECQTEREQFKNRKNAMSKLRAILYDKQLNDQIQNSRDTKKSQIGQGLRNEKIRTYNFNQDRVTDHRLGGNSGTVHDIKGVMDGGFPLNSLILKLQAFDYTKKIIEDIESCRREIESS